MKLRNKKTGGLASILADEQDFIRVYTDAGWHDYDTLAELMEEWEDYKPAEPLIKDEKIRKAVRAWAEVNSIEEVLYAESRTLCCFTDMGIGDFAIEFVGWIPTLKDGVSYTIAELCGEEEE